MYTERERERERDMMCVYIYIYIYICIAPHISGPLGTSSSPRTLNSCMMLHVH